MEIPFRKIIPELEIDKNNHKENIFYINQHYIYDYKMSDKDKNKEEKLKRNLSDIDSDLVRKIKEKYQLIKKKCGSHSPAASIVEKEIPDTKPGWFY